MHGAANPRVEDRVNTVQVLLRDRRITVDAKAAPLLVRSLEQQAYDKSGAPSKADDLDHCLDALGYAAHWQFPVGRVLASSTKGRGVIPLRGGLA
jgi:hypothetical protein